MTKTFAIAEVFATLQGEGYNAGERAVFVRFAGCNMWSGREEDRERDAQRNHNQCARFCDTDFGIRRRLTTEALVAEVKSLMVQPALVVLTGGEPALQVTHELVHELRQGTGALICMETNGTVQVGNLYLDWVTCSPKVPASELTIEGAHELKVVFPAYDNPQSYARRLPGTRNLYIQPEAPNGGGLLAKQNMRLAAQWVIDHPDWKLSVQTHKVVDLP